MDRQPVLPHADLKQTALLPTSTARAVADVRRAADWLPEDQAARALADVVLEGAGRRLSVLLERTARCAQGQARLVRALHERLAPSQASHPRASRPPESTADPDEIRSPGCAVHGTTPGPTPGRASTARHREGHYHEYRNDRAAPFPDPHRTALQGWPVRTRDVLPGGGRGLARDARHPRLHCLCQDTVGQSIGHTANNGHDPTSWVAAYEAAYGPLPDIWFTDTDGNVDQDALARYRETGTVVAEWDCSPTGGEGDDVAPDRPETARR
ncbi:hypothetical protein [Streptomyces lydicus]|uniref:hypothetical protein n=1 Tax=Streptomyces lydicus TaxID=47763 RepID=UPI0036E85C45